MARVLLVRMRKTLKAPFRKTASLVSALVLAQPAWANLVQDGTFTSITYSDNAAHPITGQLYGQFGSDSTPGQATGSTLTIANWDTSGYNFVYTTATISAGTQANGAPGQPLQAPGESNAANGYGNTFMWGKGTGGTVASGNNGGKDTITAPPGGGNIVAADGIYQTGAIKQTITGLTVGQTYVLKFEWAGAQQQGTTFTAATTENWTVSMGTGNVAGNFTTTTLHNASESFTGWQSATMYFYANNTSETLSFLAGGGPACEPPFALLADVDLEVVPDVSNWMIFTGFGAVCIVFQIVRRRRQARLAPVVA
jgi:hypothetical protein